MRIYGIIAVFACVQLLASRCVNRNNSWKKYFSALCLLLAAVLFPCAIWLKFYMFDVSFGGNTRYGDSFMTKFVREKMKNAGCVSAEEPDCPQLNSDGLIAPGDYSLARPPGVFRIVLLGDSFAAGYRLKYSQTLGGNIEKLAGNGVEVVNAAFRGSNTTAQVDYFFSKAAKYNPDMVIIWRRQDDIFSLETTHYTEQSRKIITDWGALWPRQVKNLFLKTFHNAICAKYMKYYAANTGRVVREEVETPLNRLSEYTQKKGVKTLVISEACSPAVEQACRAVERIARKNSWQLLRMEDIKTVDFNSPKLKMPGDGHPTAEANRLLAEAAYNFMTDRGMTPANHHRPGGSR